MSSSTLLLSLLRCKAWADQGLVDMLAARLVGYAGHLDAAALAQQVDFAFTDGRAGRMSREEMLAHLVAHGAYHRGEVGRILARHLGDSPPDTFTGYLHRVAGRPASAQLVET